MRIAYDTNGIILSVSYLDNDNDNDEFNERRTNAIKSYRKKTASKQHNKTQ